MKRSLRLIALATLVQVGTTAFAQQTLVRLSAYPPISVADGRSTSTISAEIRDNSGKIVPDGTRVVFSTTIGTFRETVATTINGVARAILVADGRAGIAKITATPLSGSSNASTLEYEFVGDRAMLNSAQEYIELVAPGLMHYTSDTRLIGGSGPNKGVSMRYRDVSLEADDVQINLQTMELRARKARLKFGTIHQDFDALYMRLTQRRGFGLTTFQAKRATFPILIGRGIGFAHEDDKGEIRTTEPPVDTRFGLVQFDASNLVPARQTPPADAFEMADLSFATSRVSAKKAVIFPGKQIQFHRAEIFVADSSVIRLPLFQVNMMNSTSPLVTENLVNISDNNVALNYPHYLSLKPGQTSLLRFRTGDNLGRGVSTGRGAFLDYELNWNRGDNMDGALIFQGIGRSDSSIGIRQFNRFSDAASGYLQLDMPSGRSIFGNAGYSHDFKGYQVSMTATADQTLRGLRQSSRNLTLVAETDPIKMGRTPFQAYYGVTATASERTTDLTGRRQQENIGLRARFQSRPISLDSKTTVTTGMNVGRVTGSAVGDGLQLSANTTLSTRLSKQASMIATYDYARDGFNEQFLGSHRVSLQTFMQTGRTGIRLFHSRSLDIDRMDLMGDLEYRPGSNWVMRGLYTYNRYANEFGATTWLDTQLSVGYVLGWREIGLVYSRRTRRLGIQLLGAGGF